MTGWAINIDKLYYAYRSNWSLSRKPCLENISLTVGEGESFGFLGHNGAGKTTTIKCILGLIKQSSGSIGLLGQNDNNAAVRKYVGYLPEQPYFYDYLSVRETLRLYGGLSGLQGKLLDEQINTTLNLVGLNNRGDERLRALSKGLVQRVALAQAIIAKPKLLILDEPFSGLDPIGRKEFRDIFFGLKQSGVTIFMSSHILSDVEFLCDRVSIMAQGKIKGIFDVQEIKTGTLQSYELQVRDPGVTEKALLALSKASNKQGNTLRLEIETRQSAEQALKISLEHKLIIQSFQSNDGGLEKLFMTLINDAQGA